MTARENGTPCGDSSSSRPVSACVSKWITEKPSVPNCSDNAARTGVDSEWSPPSTTGTAPADRISPTRAWRPAWLWARFDERTSTSP